MFPRRHESKQEKGVQPSGDREFASLPRWWWIAMLAVCLLGLCKLGYSADATLHSLYISPLQLDTISPAGFEVYPRETTAGRIESVDVVAHLANLDRDAGTDGWIAHIILRNADGVPMIARANATITVIPGWLATDGISFVSSSTVATRYSENLSFDESGIAHVCIQDRSTNENRESLYDERHSFRAPKVYDSRGRNLYPSFGPHVFAVLKVRVSVPTQGVFDAETIVARSFPNKNHVLGGR